ncbi:hypothetical protein BRADI_3g05210v3 [Brachypodium distachyon]|uniref:Uncharacterized protein n=1 Tax=Brachypodium distachyon TaxID=15368 RepID=A0A2K2CVD0_BRADI|nr:hypothetical protein BRADI_3g05210v3 [Brachypodium distachyon]
MATTSWPPPLASTAANPASARGPSSNSKRFLPFPSRRPRPGPGPVPRLRAGSLKEWREFEDAVESKDLSRALRFLQSVEPAYSPSETQVALPVQPGRDWEVLDACIDADDLRLVGRAYQFLSDRGLLANFGKCKNIVLEGPREVTPTILKEMTGLEAAKLAPKKWGLSGKSPYVLVTFLGGVSFLLTQGIDVRPNLAAILALATADALLLGGTCAAQISCFWPPYKRRILVHEAGHLLTAYLMGCPIRGVILDPFVALRMGIQGQAGTQFWDEKMEKELGEGHLSSTAFDRSTCIWGGRRRRK